jgi:hypothetical protein
MKDKTPLRLVASEPPPRPRVGALDLTPTGRLPHVVAEYRNDTTARTALAALDAALTLRKATAKLAGLYGVNPAFTVNRHRAHLVISAREDGPSTSADLVEALAGDIARLVEGDLQLDVSPVDLSMTLTATGIHGIQGTGVTGVWVTALVPDCTQIEGGE